MKVAAIVSEFNPFHNGHKYLVDYCRNELKADYIITIMSGDFVQRGLPAFMSKETRTKMALLSGVDAVFLLPTVYSTQSAEFFAYASVHILNRLHVVDYLVFGSESGNIQDIKDCAKALYYSNNIKSEEMQRLLREGNTFAKARATLFPEFAELLSSPNNTLGIEYCISLLRVRSSITPITVKRMDNGYNSTDGSSEGLASANAIRTMINSGNSEAVSEYYPANLSELYSLATTLDPDDFTDALYYALLSNEDTLCEFTDMAGDLSSKVRKNLYEYKSVTQFADLLKSKDLTHSGITRALMHVLLGMKGTPAYYKKNINRLTYLRLLGMRENTGELFSALKKDSSIGISAKIPDVEPVFNEFTTAVYSRDLFAFTLYDRTMANKYNVGTIKPEYSKSFIKVK